MSDMTAYYPIIIECVVNIVRVALAIAFGVLIIPWVKNCAIPWMKERRLYGIVSRFVRAAEKLGETGEISKDSKLAYVVGLLEKIGVEMSPEIRAMIESAVGDLDDELSYNLLNLADAIRMAEDEADIFYDHGKVEVVPPEEQTEDSAEDDAE